VETGLILGSPGALLSLILFSPHKGVVWLFLATIAEVPPAVSPSRFFFISSDLIPSSLQVFVSLNLNGIPFVSGQSIKSGLNSILLPTLDPFNLVCRICDY